MIGKPVSNCANIYGIIYPMSADRQQDARGNANSAVCAVVALLAFMLELILNRENMRLEAKENECIKISVVLDNANKRA